MRIKTAVKTKGWSGTSFSSIDISQVVAGLDNEALVRLG